MKRQSKSKSKLAAASTAPSHTYEPSDHDRAALARYRERRTCQAPAPSFTVKYQGDAVFINVDHPDPDYGYARLSDMLSTGDMTLAGGLLEQMADVARVGKKLTERHLNMMLATVAAIGPRDPTEALLACQMAAVHTATMMAARRLNHVENIAQQDSASTMLNKLARTFSAQIEALKRYRSSGEQNVRVTHQHVNLTAAQAVVGINQGGGSHENPSQPHEPSRINEQSAPLLGHEQTLGLPLPGAGRAMLECVPVPRCARRSAEGKG